MVKFSILQLTNSDKDLWNKYVLNNPDAHIYHLWEWGDVLCRTYGYVKYYIVVKIGGNIVGAFPLVYVKSMIFGKRLISLPFVEYAGPILSKDIDSSVAKPVLKLLWDFTHRLATRLKAEYTEIRHPPSFSFSTFLSFGFKVLQRHVTFKINLTKEESEIWKNMNRKFRNSLRKAMKTGLRIKEVDLNDLKHYYNLYLETQKRHGSPPHSFDLFLNVFNAFKQAGMLRMTMALYDSKPIAGVMVFCFKDILYWFGGVTDRKYKKLNPTNLLLWDTIQFGVKNNFKVFDLGQTRKEDRGVYHFKSGWGGKVANLKDLVFSSENVILPNPNQKKYVFLSKVWSMMPKTLARRIGPRLISEIGL
jgi:FemAB-related protein (PEP-CTERM system-associated)